MENKKPSIPDSIGLIAKKKIAPIYCPRIILPPDDWKIIFTAPISINNVLPKTPTSENKVFICFNFLCSLEQRPTILIVLSVFDFYAKLTNDANYQVLR